ncbi:MAG TPA: hypothetical protein VLU46_04895 [Thermoanaerobaculia bacterium]|nr:hypothetical protein [Thermoanaerobaculia bacterium]
MPEVYRKFGRTVRYEHGTFVRTVEAGEAIEDGDTFSCKPIGGGQAPPPVLDETDFRAAIASIPPAERLVVAEGIAIHQFGGKRWTEHTRRIHVSLVHKTSRAIIDLGDFETGEIRTIAEALVRCGDEREAPARVRLAPNVTAALLPSLGGIAPPNVRVLQTAIGVDGRGEPVVDGGTAWYRPSYRSRPVRTQMHLRAECDVVEIDQQLPRAIALLAPVEGLALRVLCVDGQDVYPATLRVVRIDAVARGGRWYPYGAGSFGSEMML